MIQFLFHPYFITIQLNCTIYFPSISSPKFINVTTFLANVWKVKVSRWLKFVLSCCTDHLPLNVTNFDTCTIPLSKISVTQHACIPALISSFDWLNGTTWFQCLFYFMLYFSIWFSNVLCHSSLFILTTQKCFSFYLSQSAPNLVVLYIYL